MNRWTPTTPPPAPRRWQSRAEILKAHLDSLSPLELLRVRPDYYAMTYGWDFKNRRYAQGRLALYEALEERAGFKPDQPRWPKGSGDDSGRWSGGAGTPSPGIDHNSGQPTRGGHHFIPREIFDSEPLRPDTRRVFEQGVTGPLNAGRLQNSTEHSIYNSAVHEHYRRFLNENRITSEDMTPGQARRLVDEVKRSTDPRVRGLNMRIYMREIMYWLRRAPRGNE